MNLTHIEDLYDLSPSQQGMLFHSLKAPDSGVYVVQLCLTLQGALNQTALQKAWQEVIQHHTILRTAFQWEGLEKPLQVVYRQAPIPFQTLDWQACSVAEQKQRLEAFLQSDRQQGFDFTCAPLMRLTLIQTGAQTYHLIWSKHHLILDGWSTGILLQQVWQRYHQLLGDHPGTVQGSLYRNYIAWLQQQDLEAAETFWRRTLEGFTAPNRLRIERPANSEQASAYLEQDLRLSPETAAALRSLARQHQLTLNTLLQGTWAILLGRYSGEADIVFGATVSGRPPGLPGVESLVGLLINTLPVRVTLSPDLTVVDWLQQLQAQQVEARQYEHSPLVQIQGWSQVPRGMPLFETLLVVENYPLDAALASGEQDLTVANVRAIEQTNYPLTAVVEVGDELRLRLGYDPQQFAADAIARFLGHWQTLLTALVENPDAHLGELSLLTPAETAQLLVVWNQTQAPYPEKCLHHLLEEQVERTPGAIAVRFGDQTLTYGALEQQANQLAHTLQNQGVGPGSLVGLCVERSPAMVMGLLGILKSGAAYVPLDPLYPPERLAFILEDSQVSMVLTQQALLATLPQTTAQILCLDTDWESVQACPSIPNPKSKIGNPKSLAYIIYTSGSTGKPKGVQISHRGLVNFLSSMAKTPGFTASDRLLAVTTLAFDIAGLELYLPLLVGGQVVLASPDVASDGEKLAAYLQEAEITVMQATPATWRLLLAAGWTGKPDLKMLCGGEALTPDLAEQLLPRGAELWNLYGPTETTIWSTVHRVERVTPTIPIGRAIANTQVYVLDPQRQPVPLGVPGELYIGGAGLAHGYLNRPELTAEKFVPHPFTDSAEAKLYRTGDLVRYRADGTLECLGRLDDQVKLRGFRVELGEIEAVLAQHQAVQAAAVVAYTEDPANPRLVAYVVLQGEQTATSQELRQRLKQQLPAYMVPTAFVALDQLPLTPNGKIDRRALPAPTGDSFNPDPPQISPRSPTEQMLHGLWCRVLTLPQASVTDNFFDLGGHSLLAMRLIAQVREQFQLEIPLQRLFEYSTIAQLAAYIDQQKQSTPKPGTAPRPIARQARRGVSLATLSGPAPASPQQEA